LPLPVLIALVAGCGLFDRGVGPAYAGDNRLPRGLVVAAGHLAASKTLKPRAFRCVALGYINTKGQNGFERQSNSRIFRNRIIGQQLTRGPGFRPVVNDVARGRGV